MIGSNVWSVSISITDRSVLGTITGAGVTTGMAIRGAAVVIVVVVGVVAELSAVIAVVGLLAGRLFFVGFLVGRLFTGRTFTVVVRIGLGVVLVAGFLLGRREGLGRLVVVLVVGVGAGACFFLLLFGFLLPDEPNRSPNKSSPKRLNPV